MIIDQFTNITIISLGSVLGANIRLFLIKKFQPIQITKSKRILIVNLIASLILGFYSHLFIEYNLQNNNQMLILFLIGFIGSLSTFSSFIYCIFKLSLKRQFKNVIKLIISSIFFCVIFFFIGTILGNI